MGLELAYKKSCQKNTDSQVTLCGRGVQVGIKITPVTLMLCSLLLCLQYEPLPLLCLIKWMSLYPWLMVGVR